MSPKTLLVVDGLPTFETSPLFVAINPATEAALAFLPETSGRIQVACRFLQRFGGSADALSVSEEELPLMWGGYLRAALMEYAGVEAAFVCDVRRLGLEARPVSILETGNALLILLRELRNIHVHVGQQRFDRSERPAVLRFDDREHATRRGIITIPSVDLRQLLAPRIAKNYSSIELERAVGWLEWAQSQWGIGDVVLSALDVYAGMLAESLTRCKA